MTRPAVRLVNAARHAAAEGRVPAHRYVGGPASPDTRPMRVAPPARARALAAGRVALVTAATIVVLASGAGWWWAP